MENTKTADINRSFTLPDGSDVTLERYTTSDVNQKVHFSTQAKKLNYELSLRGTDDIGNEVEYGLRFFADGRGRIFLTVNMDDDTSAEAISR